MGTLWSHYNALLASPYSIKSVDYSWDFAEHSCTAPDWRPPNLPHQWVFLNETLCKLYGVACFCFFYLKMPSQSGGYFIVPLLLHLLPAGEPGKRRKKKEAWVKGSWGQSPHSVGESQAAQHRPQGQLCTWQHSTEKEWWVKRWCFERYLLSPRL